MPDGSAFKTEASVQTIQRMTPQNGSLAVRRFAQLAQVESTVRKAFEAVGRDIDLAQAQRVASALIMYGGPDLDPELAYRGCAAYFDHVGTGLVLDYQQALAEAAEPSLIVARLRRKAEYRATRATRAAEHAFEAEVEADRAARLRANGNEEAADNIASGAAASHRCSERLMAEALALKADADLIEREGLEAYLNQQRA
jgi:hypothetical protein